VGYQEISIKLPPDYTEEQLKSLIQKKLKLKTFSHQIIRKSLDARKKPCVLWLVKAGVYSPELKRKEPSQHPTWNIKYKKRNKKVIVVGSGPAGLFAALALQKAGFATTLIERGMEVVHRSHSIKHFEKTGEFDPVGNYAFGEGGAGTFSDGKLTSRTKTILREKNFIISSYIRAGAPKEISYLAHPHLGSDNLPVIVENLRQEFIDLGGAVRFSAMLDDLHVKAGRVSAAQTSAGVMQADEFVIAPGHSAYETYLMLMQRHVIFRNKNFALGFRVEHSQELINFAQWGHRSLPGLKAADYRLTWNAAGRPVYTFCMCPGGTIVPAAAYKNTNIVNGMSPYSRAGKFANAACVAGIHPDELVGRTTTPQETLSWITDLEQSFYNIFSSFRAPFCSVKDFIQQTQTGTNVDSSYPLGIGPADLWNMVPAFVSQAIRTGLQEFSSKLQGFETGNLIGLESKTSAPIQVIREKNGLCSGFRNLYLVGEGSGYAGGIISSGADGIRAALSIIERDG